MCGIAGYIGKKILNESVLDRTLTTMQQRGPDSQQRREFRLGDRVCYLLHSRLSIIDLDERSDQPFTIASYTIIFNGEIYNYKEIKQILEEKGVVFKTTSDTEVLLQAYIIFGEACVDLFEGMWAFAIYDEKERKLFLSRDPFSEKPLFYMERPDGFYFASEIKSIREMFGEKIAINSKQIMRYLVHGYKSLYKSNETFFENVFNVAYATNIVINAQGHMCKRRYWEARVERKEMSLHHAIDGFREALIQSVKLRLRSDVPMAFCLSGGVDSSAIVSIAAKVFKYDVATFSIIDKDERYNEYGNIMTTVNELDCKHTLIHLSHENTLEKLRKLIAYHDAPIYTISYLIHSYLSESIANHGYRVAFSGTAADELVTGYYDHFNLYLYEMRNATEYVSRLQEWKEHIGPIVRNPFLRDPELYLKDKNVREHVYSDSDVFRKYLVQDFSETFKEEQYCDGLLRNRMLNELFHESIPVILHEDDHNSMCYSIENRSPYLDRGLCDFSYSIPTEHLMKNGYAKYVLREAMKGILNDNVRLDRQKKGFNASIHSIIDFNDKNHQAALLDDSAIFDIVKKEKIEQVLAMQRPLANSYSKYIFNFLNAKIFMEANG